MPIAEINTITGGAYTKAEGEDDGHSSDSGCQYTTATDPAGVTLNISWIDPHDYSDPAEHLALQKASLGGAALGGKLVTQSAGGASITGIPSGHFAGVGDDAVQSMTLLTARKGDYTVMVQIFPQDMMKLLQDSTYAIALWEKEKTIARTALGKL
jgi:hypothetical protein